MRDHDRDAVALLTFIGRRCSAVAATNSIKLCLDSTQRGAPYVWIDPPWSLYLDAALLVSDESCPMHSAPHYERSFSEWVLRLAPIKDVQIRDIVVSRETGIRFHFDGKLVLDIPDRAYSTDDEMWYDHWYIDTKDI